MRKVLKWIGIVLAGLIGVIVVAAIILSIVGNAKLNETVDVQAETIQIPTDATARERGEHLVKSACVSCHGADLSGEPLLDNPPIGRLYASNHTGMGETRSDEEMVLAIRHAVGQDGRQLMIMPSESFINFSAEDLGSIIAYLKSVPATGEETPERSLGPLGRVLIAAGMFGNVFPAEFIDHDQPFVEMPTIGANKEYGKYLTGMCSSCHGADLSGAVPPDPESPPAPDLTSSGAMASWTEEDFLRVMRSGVAPDGRAISPDYMPWQSFGKLDDEELQALWIYLQE